MPTKQPVKETKELESNEYLNSAREDFNKAIEKMELHFFCNAFSLQNNYKYKFEEEYLVIWTEHMHLPNLTCRLDLYDCEKWEVILEEQRAFIKFKYGNKYDFKLEFTSPYYDEVVREVNWNGVTSPNK